jgi:hypothetical protein
LVEGGIVHSKSGGSSKEHYLTPLR